MVEQLIQEEGFRLGEPWRLTDKHLTVVVPIIKIGKSGERGYVLVEEVKDKVKISDTGSINRIKVRGVDRPVFMRSGAVIEGIGTQSRAVESSKIIIPEAVVEVPVRCVHASHPIRAGGPMELSEVYAPYEVQSALLASPLGRGGQHAVWAAVSSFSTRAASSMMDSRMSRGSDNLILTMREVREFRKDVDEAISKMPVDVSGQVGVVILNMDGVLGMEMFNHPSSWTAASKAVARKYADVLAKEGKSSLFELKSDVVQTAVTEFLEGIKNPKEKIVEENVVFKTIVFEAGNIVGEYTVFKGDEIHLIATKQEETQQHGDHPIIGLASVIEPRWGSSRPRTREVVVETSPSTFFMGAVPPTPLHRADKTLLNSLTEPKQWKELEETFRKQRMSTKTLSKHLKGLEDQGLVEKLSRPSNGRSVYGLTPQATKDLVKLRIE